MARLMASIVSCVGISKHFASRRRNAILSGYPASFFAMSILALVRFRRRRSLLCFTSAWNIFEPAKNAAMVDFGPEASIRFDGFTFARSSEFNAAFHSPTNDYPLPVFNRNANRFSTPWHSHPCADRIRPQARLRPSRCGWPVTRRSVWPGVPACDPLSPGRPGGLPEWCLRPRPRR